MSAAAPSIGKLATIVGGSTLFATSMYITYQYQRMENQYQQLILVEKQQQLSGDDNSISNNNSNLLQKNLYESKIITNCSCCTSVLNDSIKRNQQYDTVASQYDTNIDFDELISGIKLLRYLLLNYHASGTVLEFGAGTGRNIPYYHFRPTTTSTFNLFPSTSSSTNKVDRVVLSDISEPMLNHSKEKVQKLKDPSIRKRFAFVVGNLIPKTTDQQQQQQQSSSSQSSSSSASLSVSQLPYKQIQLPSKSFDTVVDTFGLCSYDDPISALNEMSRLCKDDGKILLLEHGRDVSSLLSSNNSSIINKYLDTYMINHATNWGCIWNRNIKSIVEQSNVTIDIYNTYHFGTTYYIVCRPKKK